MAAQVLHRTKSVRHSHLHLKETVYGKGVFVKRKIKKGEEVGVVSGDVMDENEYESDYCMDLGHELVLEPRNIFRYMNHSCEPNCEIVAFEDADDYDIMVEALRDIEIGEQLSIDYSWPADSAIPCLCKSKKCRGWIVHPEEINEIPQRRKRQAS